MRVGSESMTNSDVWTWVFVGASSTGTTGGEGGRTCNVDGAVMTLKVVGGATGFIGAV